MNVALIGSVRIDGVLIGGVRIDGTRRDGTGLASPAEDAGSRVALPDHRGLCSDGLCSDGATIVAEVQAW